MTQEAYSHGTKDLLSLQTSSDALLQAQVSLKSEAYTLIKAILNLVRNGNFTSSGLRNTPEWQTYSQKKAQAPSQTYHNCSNREDASGANAPPPAAMAFSKRRARKY